MEFYFRFIFKSSIPFSSIVSRFRKHPVFSKGENVHRRLHRPACTIIVCFSFFSSPVCTYVIEYVSSRLSRSFTTNSPISQPSTLFTLAVPPGSIRSMEIQIEFELFAGIFQLCRGERITSRSVRDYYSASTARLRRFLLDWISEKIR